MPRQLTTSELFRLQLTGLYPDDYEVQAIQTEVKTKVKAEAKPKSLDVQPTDQD